MDAVKTSMLAPCVSLLSSVAFQNPPIQPLGLARCLALANEMLADLTHVEV